MRGAAALAACLLALTTAPAGDEDAERAFDRHHRVRLESADAALAARAAAGIGRVLLRQGRAGEAARWLATAVEEDPAGNADAVHARELAVRIVLAGAGAREFWNAAEAISPAAVGRGAVGVLRRGEETVVVDAAAGELIHLDAAGGVVQRDVLPGVELAALDPDGRVWAVAGDGVVRLEDGSAREVLAPGALNGPTALAVDAAGRLFIADRRGDRVQVVEPGETTSRTLRERKGARIASLAWDGAAVAALESGPKRLVRLEGPGRETIVAEDLAGSPSHASANPFGLVAVLDEKAGLVVLLSAEGRVVARVSARGSKVALGPDGSLTMLDERGSRLTRIP